MKALGTGHSRGVLWKDIEVFRADGPPQLRLHGGAARRRPSMKVLRSLLTITHSDALAMAQVILLGPDDNRRLTPRAGGRDCPSSPASTFRRPQATSAQRHPSTRPASAPVGIPFAPPLVATLRAGRIT